MVRLKAPEGCRHYSFDGVLHDIPENGIVDVSPDAAEALKSHGFLPPEIAAAAAVAVDAKDAAHVTREELHDMLGNLGIAVADTALAPIKMVEMLKAAVKAKADAVARAEVDLAAGASKAADDVVDTNKFKKRGN